MLFTFFYRFEHRLALLAFYWLASAKPVSPRTRVLYCSRTINQSINQSIKESINRRINQAINQLFSPVTFKSSQSINQSIDWLPFQMSFLFGYETFPAFYSFCSVGVYLLGMVGGMSEGVVGIPRAKRLDQGYIDSLSSIVLNKSFLDKKSLRYRIFFHKLKMYLTLNRKTLKSGVKKLKKNQLSISARVPSSVRSGRRVWPPAAGHPLYLQTDPEVGQHVIADAVAVLEDVRGLDGARLFRTCSREIRQRRDVR